MNPPRSAGDGRQEIQPTAMVPIELPVLVNLACRLLVKVLVRVAGVNELSVPVPVPRRRAPLNDANSNPRECVRNLGGLLERGINSPSNKPEMGALHRKMAKFERASLLHARELRGASRAGLRSYIALLDW